MLLISNVPFPLFVKVMGCGELDEPTFTWPKLIWFGEITALGCTPTPVKLTCCGPPALSSIFRLALNCPVTCGVKLTLIVQFAFTWMVEQSFD